MRREVDAVIGDPALGEVVGADLLGPLTGAHLPAPLPGDGDFDVIEANPPYVRLRDKPALARDVRHEPDVALFGGDTGLRDIEGVLDTATAKLRPGGWLVMEFGFGQEDEVRTLVGQRPRLTVDRVRNDLQGIPRTAVIQSVRPPA